MDFEFKKRSAQAREKVENLFEFEGCKVSSSYPVILTLHNLPFSGGKGHLWACVQGKEKRWVRQQKKWHNGPCDEVLNSGLG